MGNEFFSSTFYFASTRLVPGNDQGDGDIFFSAAIPGQSAPIYNLTGGGETSGDDDDHLCLWDVPRARIFFMSQRTDVGNVDGDLDIFAVPALGGTIVNLTDATVAGADGDDFCNAIHVPTGGLVFSSIRESNGVHDPDIYFLPIVVDGQGGMAPGTLKNLTDLPSDDLGTEYQDHFERLVGDKVLFTAARREVDANGIENCSGNPHIFEVDVNQTPADFVNVSQEGNDDCSPSQFSSDFFCDVVTTLDPITQQPQLEKVVFTSNQDVGTAAGHQFVLDYDVFLAFMDDPNSLVNLTDANSFGDGDDKCDRVVATRTATDANPLTTDDFAIIFSSTRQVAGTADANGVWSQSVNIDGDIDLFKTNLVDSSLTNVIVALTEGGGSDDVTDSLAGVCGTTLIINSTRSDITPNPGNDLDLYAVHFNGSEVSPMVSLTDAGTADSHDCFLDCDVTLSSAVFVSTRTDAGNTHGPSGDTDLFRSRFIDGDGNFVKTSGVVMENLTDSGTGDSYEFATSIFYDSSANQCGFSNSYLESDVGDFNSFNSVGPCGFFDGCSLGAPPEFEQDDFAFAININNTMFFTSDRTDPVNVNGDIDIFTEDLPLTLATDVTRLIINRTDASSDDDAHDGMEAYFAP